MVKKSKKILTEISVGELIDKISILEIKLNKIKGKKNLIEIKKEYQSLKKTQKLNITISKKVKSLANQLKKINLKLWGIEDKKRICEKNKDFGKSFINLARSVYLNNDKRAKIKLQINQELGSNIKEIKQYVSY
jgi:hypothetical protein